MTTTQPPTITADYPCCGKRCRVPNADDLPRQTVERRHFCSPGDETGTLYRVERRRIARRNGVEINEVTFLDMNSNEARQQYGNGRIPHRQVQA